MASPVRRDPHTATPPLTPPTLQEAVQWIARLGGISRPVWRWATGCDRAVARVSAFGRPHSYVLPPPSLDVSAPNVGNGKPIRERARVRRMKEPIPQPCRNRFPGAGGFSGGPAKHWAIAIQAVAVAPLTCRLVSAMFRTWVTTWQKSTAFPSMRFSCSGGFHSQTAPDGAVSRTDGGFVGTATPRLVKVQPKVLTPMTAMFWMRSVFAALDRGDGRRLDRAPRSP